MKNLRNIIQEALFRNGTNDSPNEQIIGLHVLDDGGKITSFGKDKILDITGLGLGLKEYYAHLEANASDFENLISRYIPKKINIFQNDDSKSFGETLWINFDKSACDLKNIPIILNEHGSTSFLVKTNKTTIKNLDIDTITNVKSVPGRSSNGTLQIKTLEKECDVVFENAHITTEFLDSGSGAHLVNFTFKNCEINSLGSFNFCESTLTQRAKKVKEIICVLFRSMNEYYNPKKDMQIIRKNIKNYEKTGLLEKVLTKDILKYLELDRISFEKRIKLEFCEPGNSLRGDNFEISIWNPNKYEKHRGDIIAMTPDKKYIIELQ